MEIIDLYDNKKRSLNKTMERLSGEPKYGEYKLSVHVWIMNSKGEFLIQKRKDELKRHPGKWGFTGGAVSSGEDSLEGAKRELEEELSIDLDEKKIELLFSIKRRVDFVDVFLLEDDIDILSLTLQDEEVEKVEWVSREKIIDLINENQFVSSVKLYKDLLFKLIDDKKADM